MDFLSRFTTHLKYSFQFILVPILISTCSSSQQVSTFQRPTKLSIGNLTALNLSEDMNEVSTQEDEILLIIYTIQNQAAAPRFKERSSSEYTFKKRKEKFDVDLDFILDDPTITGLLFCLVELDNEESQTLSALILDQYLENTPIEQIENFAINRALGFDDFLDWVFIDISKKIPNKIQFKGLQMFDRFEYNLEISHK